MLPQLTIGHWHVATYVVAVGLAIFCGGALTLHRLARLPTPPERFAGIIALCVAAGLGGALLINGIPTTVIWLRSGVWTWNPGISVIGAVLAGGAAFALSCRLAAIPLGEALDLVVPGVVLGQAIGRLGCLAAGCCYGEETDSWLGVYLPDSHGEWANRYPTQLMSIGADLLILGILLVAERRWTRRRPEMLAALYFTLFAVKRFLMQYPARGRHDSVGRTHRHPGL